ncbi:accessory Sec system protein Asp2, partial [Pseudomonas aeruginosa]
YLEYLFKHKPEVACDYFDTQLFEFDSGYIDSIKEIVEESGQFDLLFIQANLTDALTQLLHIVSHPYNTLVDAQYWPS